MVLAYVGLGANLGAAARTLAWAVEQLAGLPHCSVCGCSSLYSTAPVDATGPDFMNAVVALNTRLPALSLLKELQQIELMAGRQRPYRNAPRTLDLDLLLYGSAHIDTPALQVPHPRMAQRAFVLHPLAELAPEWVTPQQLQSVRDQHIRRVGVLK